MYSCPFNLTSYPAISVNQLTFLYNVFCLDIGAGKEISVVFCDISKAFDRIWHAGIIHKLDAASVAVSGERMCAILPSKLAVR